MPARLQKSHNGYLIMLLLMLSNAVTHNTWRMLPTLTSSVRQKSQSFIELVTQHMSYICASFFGGQDDTMLHHDAYPMLGTEDQALDTKLCSTRHSFNWTRERKRSPRKPSTTCVRSIAIRVHSLSVLDSVALRNRKIGWRDLPTNDCMDAIVKR